MASCQEDQIPASTEGNATAVSEKPSEVKYLVSLFWIVHNDKWFTVQFSGNLNWKCD